MLNNIKHYIMIVAVGVTIDNSAWQRALHTLAPQKHPKIWHTLYSTSIALASIGLPPIVADKFG